jgi:hypothetical protein
MLDKLFNKLLPLPPRPAVSTRARIGAWFDAMFSIFVQMPHQALDGAEARRLGQYLFMEGPLLVQLTVQAMRRDPGLYAHCPGLADEMAASLSRARAFWPLRALGEQLVRISDAQRILLQAGAVRAALQVIKDAEEQGQRPFGDPEVARERLEGLMDAIEVLRHVRRRMGGRHKGGRRQGGKRR